MKKVHRYQISALKGHESLKSIRQDEDKRSYIHFVRSRMQKILKSSRMMLTLISNILSSHFRYKKKLEHCLQSWEKYFSSQNSIPRKLNYLWGQSKTIVSLQCPFLKRLLKRIDKMRNESVCRSGFQKQYRLKKPGKQRIFLQL